MAVKDLVLVLGDQLSPRIAALREADRDDSVILIVEVAREATYVPHHKKKLVFIFSAMRHFAQELRDAGWTVDYVMLDEPGNTGSFAGEIGRALDRHPIRRIIVTEPGEWRVRAELEGLPERFGIYQTILEDDRFLCSHQEFSTWAEGRKQLRMEYFYRHMRKKTGLLMEGGAPAGGQWNYDADNRKPAEPDLFLPQPVRIDPDAVTRDVIGMVQKLFPNNFGCIEPFWFAVTATDANRALEHFITEALPQFGDYQDAMLTGKRFLYHSVLALYMNAGLLDPLAVCQRVAAAYDGGNVPLNAAEGFIRQIIGWREFVRGIYWREGPDYITRNFLEADRALPAFYWTGETGLACLAEAIGQTQEDAYAHHIQRLMLTGNFALLAGIEPHQVHEWYLAVYADAYEWVEAPNTIGMSQFADGGVVGSKPYAAGGSYINRMSDHCGHCRYAVKEKTGPTACPFNYLYWDFLARNEGKLRGNPRLGPVYSTWDRMKPATQQSYRDTAAAFLAKLDEGTV